jgi:hypothetical protein
VVGMHLSQPQSIEKLVVASGGYDLPSFANLTTLKIWAWGRTPERDALPLSQSLQPPDPFNRRGASPAENRQCRYMVRPS